MDSKLRNIVAAGIRAPSGDNCQPWRFRIRENSIDLFDVPQRDTSLYNYRQRASLVAHGACLENMAIAASALGYAAQMELFPTPGDDRHVARMALTPSAPAQEPLYGSIAERTINRGAYCGGSLSATAAESLEQAARCVDGARLTLLTRRDQMAVAADVVALSDRLVFENELLHGFLFDHIRWSAAQAEKALDGLDLRTLELAPADRLLFPLLRSFPLVRVLGFFGVTGIIAANARKLMLSASAAGMITIPDTSAPSWVAAGRQLERVWLEATRQGLCFHLMTGMTLLVQRTRDGAAEGLSEGNRSLVQKADELLKGVGASKAPVALLFRLGKGGEPSARSLRKDLDAYLGE